MKIDFVDYLKFKDFKCFVNNGVGKLDFIFKDYLILLIGLIIKFVV